MDRCEPFSAFSSDSEGKAGFGGRVRNSIFGHPDGGRTGARLRSWYAVAENLPREAPSAKIVSQPDIPFLGIKQVNSMKKSVDPHFRSS